MIFDWQCLENGWKCKDGRIACNVDDDRDHQIFFKLKRNSKKQPADYLGEGHALHRVSQSECGGA